MIVAVVSEKGGTGKTTIAIHLAGWRAKAGHDVLLIDTDRQGSATYWLEVRRERDLPSPSITQAVERGLSRTVTDMARRHDDLVVDVGAGEGIAIRSIMRVADFTVIPLQPNELDFWTLGLLDDLAGEARKANDNLVVKAVLNRAPTHHADTDAQAARESFDQCREVESSGIVIRERSSIRRAVPTGMLIDEWRPRDPKSIKELAAVYRMVFNSEFDELSGKEDTKSYSGSRR